ncbi:MAG TPA: T9SS type A sorting domain-containing protein [Bacteroidia bacterium]|jgi:hypothetical protein
MYRKIFLFLFSIPWPLMAQDAYFEKVYGTPGNDFSRSVKQLESGSIYVLGNSDSGNIGTVDISVTKLDVQGNEIWTNYYGTVNNDNAFYLNTCADGSFVLVAETESGPNDLDILIYKIDTAGAVIWSRSFASPVNETPKYIEELSYGGYILCGTQNDIGGSNDILVVRLDTAGNYVWHTNYGRTDNEYSDMIHQVGNEFILTADTRSYGAGGYDVILYRLDSLGNEIWSHTYGDSLQNGCQGLLLVSDGNYLSYGETEIFPFSPYDFYLEKIDSSGGSIWRYTYGGAGSDAIFSVKEDDNGDFICTGYSNSYNGMGPVDLVILKVSANGIFQWKQTYGGAGIDIGFEIIKANDNEGFIITGQTYNGSDEYYLLKLDENAEIIGVPEITNKNFVSDAFPNPAAADVTIRYSLEDVAGAVFVLTDITGRKIREARLAASEGMISLDISGVSPGTYLYSVGSEKGVLVTKKLMILHR